MVKRGRKPTVSDQQILREFIESADPVFVASELTDALGMSRQGVLDRLDGLEAEGYLRSKKASGRRMFWITHDGRLFYERSSDD